MTLLVWTSWTRTVGIPLHPYGFSRLMEQPSITLETVAPTFRLRATTWQRHTKGRKAVLLTLLFLDLSSSLPLLQSLPPHKLRLRKTEISTKTLGIKSVIILSLLFVAVFQRWNQSVTTCTCTMSFFPLSIYVLLVRRYRRNHITVLSLPVAIEFSLNAFFLDGPQRG